MNVLTFKLVTGEEIVADVNVIGTERLSVTNPVMLQHMKNPDGEGLLRVFVDWPALAAPGQSISIPYTALLTHPATPHEELERQYVANITGLELPPADRKILLS